MYSEGANLWKYYSRDHTLIIGTTNKEQPDTTEEVYNWCMTLLHLEANPWTKAISKKYISKNARERYFQLYNDQTEHYCDMCAGKMKIP